MMMIGIYIGAKKSLFLRHSTKLGYFPIKESTTIVTSMKFAGRTFYPKMSSVIKRPSSDKARLNRQLDMTIYL